MSHHNHSTEDFLGREFLITREFDAPRELVFKSWTDAKHLMQWWGPHGFTAPVCQWDAKPGNTLYLVMRAPNGMEFPLSGEFVEVVAPEKLVFTCRALDEAGKTMFEFIHAITLAERNGKTFFTIKSRVTKTTPGSGQHIGGYEPGMTQSLERLAETLAVKSEPVIVERTFNAPVGTIWRALTSNQELKQWYFNLAEFKPVAGFAFEFTVEQNGVKYIHKCKITEAIPNKKLAYTWRYEGFAGGSLVTVELFAEGNKTKVKLTHEGLETFPKLPSFDRANFQMGWTHIIRTSLKDYLEKG